MEGAGTRRRAAASTGDPVGTSVPGSSSTSARSSTAGSARRSGGRRSPCRSTRTTPTPTCASVPTRRRLTCWRLRAARRPPRDRRRAGPGGHRHGVVRRHRHLALGDDPHARGELPPRRAPRHRAELIDGPPAITTDPSTPRVPAGATACRHRAERYGRRMAAAFPFRSALVTVVERHRRRVDRQLAAGGVPVVAVARRADRLAALAAELGTVEVLAADLGGRAGQELVAARVSDPDHPVDLVVNNAGFGTSGARRPRRRPPERRIALTSTRSARLTTRRSADGATARLVLNVSSSQLQPAPRLAVYTATKAFVTSRGRACTRRTRVAGSS